MTDSPKVPPAPAPAYARNANQPRRIGEVQTLTAAAAMLDAPLTRNAPQAGDDERRQPQVGGIGSRALALAPESYNAEARTIEAVLSAGTPVRRYWFTESLEITAEAIDLARVTGGVCPLLDTHNQYQLAGVIGRVITARIENGQLIGVLQFADTPAGRDIEARVAAGEIRAISVGYRVTRWQMTETDDSGHETWRAMAWELLEASFVPVPADPNAVVRSAQRNPSHGNQEEDDMRRNHPGGAAAAAATTPPAAAGAPNATEIRNEAGAITPPAAAAEPQRAAEPQTSAAVDAAAVRTAAANAGLDAEATLDLISRHADQPFTRDALMADIGRRFAERDSGARTVNRISVTRDAGDTMRRGMQDAILHRIAPGTELTEQGRMYRGMSLLRMAEDFLGHEGVNVRGWAPTEIAERALHSTSDFPALMANGMNRRLRMGYEENEPSYTRWARRAPNAPNFKSIDVVQMSALPDLLKVNEGGEVKFGSISDGKVSYTVVTYQRALGISRQTIVNDDLRALERLASGFAGAARRLENRLVYAQLTSNPTMPDGVVLFHADHGNLGTGVIGTAANGPTGLETGREKMRLQKGLQAEELNLAPRFLIAPAKKEQDAYRFTSSQFVPAKSGDVNEFRQGGRTALEPIVEALLDGTSGLEWYLAANNAECDTVEYCYLEGTEGVQISSRLGFTTDGVEVKASLDFGAAVIDHRGLYKSSGA